MSLKERLPLEKRKNLLLYVGDWERLERILAPSKISPTKFIRELVHRSLNRIEARAQDSFKNVEINDDDLSAVTSDSDLAE